ncbi:protein dd3-3-like, partial [Plakobranchus ocellatus]
TNQHSCHNQNNHCELVLQYMCHDNVRDGTTTQSCGGASMASESILRSAGTLLSRVPAPPPSPWPGGGPKSLRAP